MRALLAACLLLPLAAQAATYRVGSCETAPAPYATIAAALTAAQAAVGPHTVRVCPGSYGDALSISHANHAGLSLVSTTGNAADVVISRYGPGAAVLTVSQANVTVQGVTVQNTSWGQAILSTAAGFTLSSSSLSGAGHGVELRASGARLSSINVTTSGSYIGAVYLNGATGLVMDGASTLTATNPYGYGIYDSNTTVANPTLSGLTISAGYGLLLRRTGAINLSNSSITATYSAGLYLFGGTGAHVLNNLTVTAAGIGVQINGAASATLTDVDATITGANYCNAPVHVTGVTGNVTITASAKANVRYTAAGATNYGIYFCSGSDSSVLSVSKAIINTANHGIIAVASGCSAATYNLSNLTVESASGSGLYLDDGRGAHSLSSITSSGAQHGIYIKGGASPNLSNLTLVSGSSGANTGMAGLHLQDLTSANLSGVNTITGRAPTGYGIRLTNCDSCLLTGATIDMTGQSGSYGIYLDTNSERVTVSGNTVRNAPASGIHARASRPTVHSNVVENSATGGLSSTAGLALSSDGSAYNNCLYNAASRNGLSSGATFYSGSTGNFWGSWPAGSGYSDSCADADSDGDCDSAYTYSGSYQDRYPLKRCSLTEPPPSGGSGYCAYIPSYQDGTLTILDTATDARRESTSAISLGGSAYAPLAVAVKSNGSRAYTTASSRAYFSVVDVPASRLLKNYSLSDPGQAIALNPTGTRLYINRSKSDGQDARLRVYDTTSLKLLKSVTLSSASYVPRGLAVSPDGASIWVNNGRVQKITASNNTLASSLSVTGVPGGIVVSPDNATVYAVKGNGSGADGIHVITASNNTLARSINFGFANGSPLGIVLSPDGATAWVALAARRSLMKVTLASGAVQEIALSGLGAPAGVDITPDGAKVYVGSSSGNALAAVTTATLAVNYISLVNKPAAYGRFIAACPGSAAPPAAPSGFNAFETNTASGALDGVIRTKVAGSAFSLDLIALRSDGGSINTSFNGGVKVELTDATSGACAERSAIGASSTVTWVAGDQGRKRATFTENDAWPNVGVRMIYPASGTPSITACSVDAFAIRPASLSISATDGGWDSAGASRSLNNSGASGGVIHKAGQPFTLTVTARNSAGAVTANYEGSPEISLESFVLPASDCAACVLDGGGFSGQGVLTSDTANYSDVGVITLRASDSGFAAVDVSDSSDEEMALTSPAITVGRFVPDHFEISANTPAFTPGCGSFTYAGQPFTPAVEPLLTVSAMNAAGGVTENYTGSLWKLAAGGLNPVWSAASGVIASVDASLPAPVVTDLGGGRRSTRFGLGTGPRFARTALAAPFTASLSLSAIVSDSEGVAYDSNPYTLAGIGFSGGQGEIRFGRLRMGNVSGSERLALPVPSIAQYWNGQGFVTNLADGCTSLPAPTLTFFAQSADNRLASGETTASYNATLIAGNAGLRLSAPGAGNTGYADAAFTVPEWLRYNWDGVDQAGDNSGLYDDHPHARASFGIRKGRDKVIIRRELY